MRLVIVEDEVMIAKRLKMFCSEILQNKLQSLQVFHSLADAQDYLDSHTIDVLLLDLNLHHQDGFELLKNKLSASFHTIVVSANSERAVEAFEYGVLDFIAKPFNQERLRKAFARLESKTLYQNQTKYLSINKHGRIELIKVEDISYIQAASHYSEVHLIDGTTHLHEKNLARLLQTLPINFQRVHKSYALAIEQIKALHKYPGSKYELELTSGIRLPLGRTRYQAIKNKIAHLTC